jgi:phage terminase large subunit-like protein
LNPEFNAFKKQLASPFSFKLFLLTKLPSAFFAGLKLIRLVPEEAAIGVNYKWFNKNPFRSMYFAVLSMAAEASTGILCMSALYKRKPSVSMLIVRIEGNFYKKAVGQIIFTCPDGMKIQQAVEDALNSDESKSITCESTGKNESGEIVAQFFCTWSFKSRSRA